MKFADNSGRIMGKFSIVDLFAVVLVVACILAVGTKLQKKQEISGGDTLITYTVRIENIRDMSVNAIKQNFKGIIDAENKKEVGDITDIRTSPARVLVQTNDGEYKLEEYNNRYDALITLLVSGNETNDGYYTASGRQIIVGESIGFNNGYAQFFAEVVSVETAEKK